MGRSRDNDEATRVDASILRKQREASPPESFDEPTALMRRDKPGSAPVEITVRNRPAVDDEPTEGTVVARATVAGRLDHRDEAPPLPFSANSDSAPPPPAIDLYGSDEDPLEVTGKLKGLRSAALPFEVKVGAEAPPPAVDALDEPGDRMTDTSTMLHKVKASALPFDGPQPKYPPKQLVPLEQNPLYAGGTTKLAVAKSAGPDKSRLVVVVLVVVAIAAVALLLMRSAGT